MSDKIEIQGKTVEAAVSEALLQMGARRDEVEIKVIEEPKSGFMGFIGGRAAKVLVRRKRSRSQGGGRDHRVNDEDYQAHNLGKGQGRSRGGSRGSAGSSPKGGGERPQASSDNARGEKNGSRRGSRGRGGRGRNQEAAGRDQAQGQRQGQRQDRPQGQRQGQQQDRPQGQRQDQQQGQRQDRNQGQPNARGQGSLGRNRRGDRDNRQPAKQETRQDNQQDNRPDQRTRAPQENTRPVQAAREDFAPRKETPIRPLKQEPVPTPVVSAPPTPVREETKAIEPKKEITVTKPNKPRRGFGGLGSRIKEKRLAAQAPPAESPAVEETPAVNETPRVAQAPVAPMSRPRPERRERRPSSYSSSHAGEEVVLSGIKGVKYAKPVGKVTDEGLDEALTELTDAMLARAGFPCQCETFPGEYRQIKVTTDDASAGMLIGRHGQTVDAVEHLVERMASNAIDARARINLDINNYRMEREESLVERVTEAGEKVHQTGRSVHMEPMSGRERRIVHLETEKLDGLRTFTMDGSGGKHVVIALEEEATQEVSSDVQPDGAEDQDHPTT